VALPSCGTDPAALGTVADDAAAVEAAVADIAGDVVVVGHSYGGVVITEARLDSRVRHLVYLGAFMPDTAQSLFDLFPPGLTAPYMLEHADGYIGGPGNGDRFVLRRLRCGDSALGGIAAATSQECQQRHPRDPRQLAGHDLDLRRADRGPRLAGSGATQTRGTGHRTARTADVASPFLSRPAELAVLLCDVVVRASGETCGGRRVG
jgi:pimeloyl-ACP methyl ester carboxylesterase